MLRLKYIFVPDREEFRDSGSKTAYDTVNMDGQTFRVLERTDGLGHLHLIYDYEVITERDRIFAAMASNFDPAKKVILESQPQPVPEKPASGNGGEVRIIDSSTDHMSIQAELTSPAILLITDGYNRDWRASSLEGSAQTRYQVIPANYVLMAVPLLSGRHHFRLEYSPKMFEVGKWISIASLAAFLAGTGWLMWFGKRKFITS